MSDAELVVAGPVEAEKRDVGLGLVVPALVLPVIAGLMLCFVTSFTVSLTLSFVTVVTTSALLSVDAFRLGKVDKYGKERDESAGLLFFAMILLWVVGYPFALFRRSAFASPNLGFVGLLVTIFFMAAPWVASAILPAPLPSCSSSEVKQILAQILREDAMVPDLTSIDGHRQVSYEAEAGERIGECILHTDSGDLPIKFIVEWQDRANRLFQVRLADPILPTCSSPEVVSILDQVLRNLPMGASATSITGHRELRYDPRSAERFGECTLRTDDGNTSVRFIVEWQDREKGLFQVRLLPSELPECSSPEVVQLLEQLLRDSGIATEESSVVKHRQVSFDSTASTRLGECVVNGGSDELTVQFLVQWQDRDRGLFQVLVLGSAE